MGTVTTTFLILHFTKIPKAETLQKNVSWVSWKPRIHLDCCRAMPYTQLGLFKPQFHENGNCTGHQNCWPKLFQGFRWLLLKGKICFIGQTVAVPCLSCFMEAVKGVDCRDKAAMCLLFVSERRWGWKEVHTSAVFHRDTLQEWTMSSWGECATQEDRVSQVRTCRSTCRLSQTAPVLAKRAWLHPADTCPALPEPITTAALWKCGHVECGDKHCKAAELPRCRRLGSRDGDTPTSCPAQPGHALFPSALTSWRITHT